ncbi:hypothetical protein ACFWF9_35355 [Streptomyces roseolus]|uniref:hypothetical protein n=1 Tax=Streptomyces roseolus TaxID=67358 RepID=UPI003652989D
MVAGGVGRPYASSQPSFFHWYPPIRVQVSTPLVLPVVHGTVSRPKATGLPSPSFSTTVHSNRYVTSLAWARMLQPTKRRYVFPDSKNVGFGDQALML